MHFTEEIQIRQVEKGILKRDDKGNDLSGDFETQRFCLKWRSTCVSSYCSTSLVGYDNISFDDTLQANVTHLISYLKRKGI